MRLLAAVVVTLLSAVPLPGQEALREQAADQQILHALNRLAFGPRPGDGHVAGVAAAGG